MLLMLMVSFQSRWVCMAPTPSLWPPTAASLCFISFGAQRASGEHWCVGEEQKGGEWEVGVWKLHHQRRKNHGNLFSELQACSFSQTAILTESQGFSGVQTSDMSNKDSHPQLHHYEFRLLDKFICKYLPILGKLFEMILFLLFFTL